MWPQPRPQKAFHMRPWLGNKTSTKTSKGLEMRPQVWNMTSTKTSKGLDMRPQVWNMASTKTSKGAHMRPQVWYFLERIGKNKISIKKISSLFLNLSLSCLGKLSLWLSSCSSTLSQYLPPTHHHSSYLAT